VAVAELVRCVDEGGANQTYHRIEMREATAIPRGSSSNTPSGRPAGGRARPSRARVREVVAEECRGVVVDEGKQSGAPEPVAAGGDQANHGLGFAARARARERREGRRWGFGRGEEDGATTACGGAGSD
jgi:hypothetical protein